MDTNAKVYLDYLSDRALSGIAMRGNDLSLKIQAGTITSGSLNGTVHIFPFYLTLWQLQRHLSYFGQFMNFCQRLTGVSPSVDHIWNHKYIAAFAAWQLLLHREKKNSVKTITNRLFAMIKILKAIFPAVLLRLITKPEMKEQIELCRQ